jgi:hypothetical protein
VGPNDSAVDPKDMEVGATDLAEMAPPMLVVDLTAAEVAVMDMDEGGV